jgi:hypothetical protein
MGAVVESLRRKVESWKSTDFLPLITQMGTDAGGFYLGSIRVISG